MQTLPYSKKNELLPLAQPGTKRTGSHKGSVRIKPRSIYMLSAILAFAIMLSASTLLAGENRVSVAFLPELSGTAEALGNGGVFWLGVDMQIKEGWHIYWRNPGDSGLPTSIRWEQHSFLKPGDIHWPRPSRFDEDGITTYGYSDRVTLLVPVLVDRENLPDALAADGGTAHSHTDAAGAGRTSGGNNPDLALTADINWLVCKDICLPESARVSLSISDSGYFEAYSEGGAGQIEHSLTLVPESLPDWQGAAVLDDGLFTITLTPATDRGQVPDLQDVYFYPDRQGQIEHTAPQEVSRDGERVVISIPVSRYLRNAPETMSGVLYAGESWVRGMDVPAFEIALPVSEKPGSGITE